MEAKEEILRQFKLSNWLMAARAELYGFCKAVRIGQFLSDVAQVIVNQVLAIASEQLCLRYPEMEFVKSQFAIIAYGKLGSREMNYASDLDLVFLHSAKLSEESLITRLTQKILHMLTTRSQSGVLYTVDTRLRPSGAAGLLVSHVDAFVEYQKTRHGHGSIKLYLKHVFYQETKGFAILFYSLRKRFYRRREIKRLYSRMY